MYIRVQAFDEMSACDICDGRMMAARDRHITTTHMGILGIGESINTTCLGILGIRRITN